MTETSPAEQYAWRTSTETGEEERTTDVAVRTRARQRNSGWVRFVGVMLVMTGAFQILTGVSALLRRETFLVPEERLLLDVDYMAWGWVYVALGVVALAAALGVSLRRPWARAAGICLAVLSAVGNLGFLPVRPFMAATVIALDVLVIYGIAVHGGRGGTRFYVDRA